MDVELRSAGRIVFPVGVAAVIAAALLSPLGEWVTVARLAESRDALCAMIEARPLLCCGAFLLFCIAASALCFPAAPVIGVAAGALFGFWLGLAMLAVGFTIGSTLACLASRHWFRDPVQARLARRMEAIDRGLQRHGAGYLLALRINPLIPYWVVNLAMGLTAMPMRSYVPLTAVGLLPALFIYSQAGAQLAAARGGGEIFSPGLLVALFLLSLLLLVAERLRSRGIAA